MLMKAKTRMAADERRSTLIERNWFIRVHRRFSAANGLSGARYCVPELFVNRANRGAC
jgi:hypothetical protein